MLILAFETSAKAGSVALHDGNVLLGESYCNTGLTLYKIDAVMDGGIDELIDALATADQAEKLKNSQ